MTMSSTSIPTANTPGTAPRCSKDRFWLTLVLSVPVVYFSPMFGHLLGYMPPEFPGTTWIPPVPGTGIFLYGGMPFLKGGLNKLKSRQPGDDPADRHGHHRRLVGDQPGHRRLRPGVLVGAGPAGGHHAAGPLDREMRAPRLPPGALDVLAALLPDEAERITETGTETVSISEPLHPAPSPRCWTWTGITAQVQAGWHAGLKTPLCGIGPGCDAVDCPDSSSSPCRVLPTGEPAALLQHILPFRGMRQPVPASGGAGRGLKPGPAWSGSDVGLTAGSENWLRYRTRRIRRVIETMSNTTPMTMNAVMAKPRKPGVT